MSLFSKIRSLFRRKKRKNKASPVKIKAAKQKKIEPVIPPQEKIVRSEGRVKVEHAHKPIKKEQDKRPKNKSKPQAKHASTDVIHKVTINLPPQVKLVFTGSVGAGKTTAIQAVSEKAAATTEAAPSDHVKVMKDSTTTSMDYGSYQHPSGSRIHVYGTPGQQRFSFMSAILTKGANGLIILINNNQDEPLNDLDHYLKNNEKFLSNSHAVVGITHLDVKQRHDLSIYTDFMEEQGIHWPVMPIDARKSTDVLLLADRVMEAAFSSKFH